MGDAEQNKAFVVVLWTLSSAGRSLYDGPQTVLFTQSMICVHKVTHFSIFFFVFSDELVLEDKLVVQEFPPLLILLLLTAVHQTFGHANSANRDGAVKEKSKDSYEWEDPLIF